MYVVIRAGGIGTRLWPLSRPSDPKQFQNLITNRSMIRETFERLRGSATPDEIFITVHRTHLDRVRAELPEIAPDHIIAEPETRNTGPAMCLEVAYLERVLPPDAIVASIPSDDYVKNPGAFREVIASAAAFIRTHETYVVTPGAFVEIPDTGYSYFEAGTSLEETGQIVTIQNVVEKPNHEHLRELLATGRYYAHTGMYVWNLRRISALFKEFQPDMYRVCASLAEGLAQGAVSKDMADAYAALDRITIETAITDRCETLAMIRADSMGWSDVGKWHVVKRVLEDSPDGVVTRGNVHVARSSNSLVVSSHPAKPIVINDVRGLCIIDTPDGLYVSSLDSSADIKDILDQHPELSSDSV